ncbi:MAG: TIM barrel protein, partial [Phycisphaerae bacterium]
MAKKTKASPSAGLADSAISRLTQLKIEVPSWGFANTGTRFGKYLQPAAAVDLQDKLADAGTVHKYTGATPTVAVHVLWDFPDGFDPEVIKLAESHGVQIGSINPNLFQDQCYKHGSVTNRDAKIRRQAVKHIQDSIEIGRKTHSRFLSLWFADGANYPGAADIRQRKKWATKSLQTALSDMPKRMTALIEYKPYEPAAYFTDFFDWGSSYIFAKACGPQAKVLVDTGHHLLGTNIEQIVAWLLDEKMLGGFHFNDRKFADDDLTVGSIDPYQAFRIFNEIVAYEHETGRTVDLAWMIDQSHNIKPKIQATIQTVCTVQQLFAKAMLVDRDALAAAQANEDVVGAEEILRAAYHADVTDILTAARKILGAPADPLAAYRDSGHEAKLGQ